MSYRNFFKIFTIGAVLYSLLEILWRGYTHWSMTLTGGFCFSFLCKLFKKMKKCSIIKKCICGGIVITATEFISGLIFNILLKLDVWDYSKNKFNIAGQICPLFFFMWCILCHPVTFLSKWVNKTLELK